jgi:cation diffusion facilitator family transporter
MNPPALAIAEREKTRAAVSSVIAAVGLTMIKVIVGIATGSLGILAEAAHSALDLVAALVTYLAVRTSGKPADEQHPYGHGKVENLSALFETLLLLITCAWIVYEAIQRVFFKAVAVEVTMWAFIVMGVSIIVDVNRSRMLYRAAHRHKSQALEADALHFRTDIWSSSVVILGLVGVKIAEWVPALGFLHEADAVAALGVALIVVYVSMRLGIRTAQALLDAAPPGLAERITAVVEAIPGVTDCHNVRLRRSGPYLFADLHILVDGKLSLQEAHSMTEVVEDAIHHIAPDADVTVHAEPMTSRTAPLLEQVALSSEGRKTDGTDDLSS